MSAPAPALSSSTITGIVLAAMAVLALIETIVPLHSRGRWNRAHLTPNLMLTGITFAIGAVLNSTLVLTLTWLDSKGLAWLSKCGLSPLTNTIIVIVVLDFAFYVAHVAMHKVPTFWRFHRVHHSDPAVDVTTTLRQHPGESVIRSSFTAVFAIGLGASPGAFAIYQLSSVLNGFLEHANLGVPLWLDRLLVLITTWPSMHKIHHSRCAAETDTNYGNIFSLFDRVFLTFTPSTLAVGIVYGLSAFDEPDTQSTAGLLRMPFGATARSLESAPPVFDTQSVAARPR
ncbi:MAG TPA: sterol desaturase family protein [Burkholderiales bacterium]|nr:sterol desaturase family protein [Burkholderiales bacterium]